MEIRFKLAVPVIVLATVVVYSNTFFVPYIFDDFHAIVNNEGIRNLSNLTQVFFSDSPNRPFLYLTFAINYALGGLETFGFHFFNITTHILASIVVFVLLNFLLKKEKIESDIYPFFGALLFALHPLQVEAVTYISARSSSLTSLLYFLAFYLFISKPLKAGVRFYLALLFFGLALLSKELAITLPALLTIYLFQFSKGDELKKSLPYLFVIWLEVPLYICFRYLVTGYSLEAPSSSAYHFLTPLTYFKTELSVVAFSYIPKLFVPLGLVFDGDAPWEKSFLDIEVIGGFLVFIALLATAFLNFKKRKLLSFSILWFLTTLSVTSSFYPILDSYVERRLYIAMPAFSLFLIYLLHLIVAKKLLTVRQLQVCLVAVLLFFSILSYQRNQLYNDPLLLWADTIKKTDTKSRPYSNLSYGYIKNGEIEKAKSLLNFAIRAFPEVDDTKLIYCWILGNESRFAEMEKMLDKIKPKKIKDVAQVYNLRGVLAGHKGDFAKAGLLFKKSLGLNPSNTDARANFGVLLRIEGRIDESIDWLKESARIYPLEADFNFQLANSYVETDRPLALKEYQKALRKNRRHTGALKALKEKFNLEM